MEGYTEEQKQRAKECSDKVNEILVKYNCDISARVVITEQGTVIQKAIIAKSSIIKPPHTGN